MRSKSIGRFSLNVALGALTLAGCARKDAPPAPQAAQIYISDERGDAVIALDAAGKPVARIAAGKRPRGIQFSKDGATLYVAVSGSPIAGPGVDESTLPPADHRRDGIAVIDVASGTVTRTLPAGTDPETFTLSADGQTLFVSNEDSGEVSAIDVTGVRVARGTKVGDEPEGVAVTPDGAHLFVACEGSDHVAMLDARSLRLIRTIPIEGRPRGALASADSSMIFVSVEGAGKVAILSAKDGSILKLINVAAGNKDVKPMGIVEAPGGHIFVSTGRGGGIAEIDPVAGTIVRQIKGIGARPWGIGLTRDGATLVTANGPSGEIALIDRATGAVRAHPKIGVGPWGVAIPGGVGGQ